MVLVYDRWLMNAKYGFFPTILWQEQVLNSDGHQFHQNYQNEQSPITFTQTKNTMSAFY